MDKFTRLVVAYLREHKRQERVRRDIEGHAEERIGTALVKLATEFALAGLAYPAHVELKQAMARRQGHLVDFGHIPCTHQVAARIGIVLEAVDQILDLVDVPAIGGRPAAPLVAVNRTQVTVLVGPLVPDGHLVVVQVLDVRVALQEPQQLMNNRAQVQFLCGKARKPLRKVVTALAAKHGARARTRTVGTVHAIFKNISE